MRQTLRIYFLCKAAHTVSRNTDTDYYIKPLRGGVDNQYKKWHRFTSKKDMRLTFGQAVQFEYLKEVKEPMNGWSTDFEVRKVELLDKGMKIIDTYPFPFSFVPSGLIEAWWNENNAAVKLLIALAFGGFGVTIMQAAVFLITQLSSIVLGVSAYN